MKIFLALALTIGLGATVQASDADLVRQARMAQLTEAVEELPTGTLLFSEGDCLAVKVFTRSDYTHVAAVVVRNGQPVVYDSNNGVGVRCQSLQQYLDKFDHEPIHVYRPAVPFSPSQTEAFERHLDSELGRPYAVLHHVSGQQVEGVHCAEYLTEALMAAQLLKARRPAKVSPASLAQGIVQSDKYTAPVTVRFQPPTPAPPAEEQGWCRWMWTETVDCTTDCCRQMKRWILCR